VSVTYWLEGWVCPTADLDFVGGKKILPCLPKIELRFTFMR